jgi:hypothetical protein
LGILTVTLLLRSLGMVLPGSNFGPIQIEIGHRTRPRGVFEPIRIKVPIEVIMSLSPLKEVKDGE